MRRSSQWSLAPSYRISSIFLLSTLFTSGIFSQRPDCTRDVFITGDISFSSADSTPLTTNIELTGEISLSETICFYVTPELNESIFETYQIEIGGEYSESHPIVYVLSLTQVTRTYPPTDQYTFGRPSLSYNCVCDCPGGSEHCTEETDYCASSPGPICVNVLVETAAAGCPLSFLSSSTTCCAVTISPSEDYNRYTAYHLGDSETVFDFTLSSFYTSNDAVFESPRQITAVLMADDTTDDGAEAEISITANKLDALDIPTSNLYSNEIGGDVMWGVEVNEINEWDFHKLGWFKVEELTVTVEDTERLKDVVTVNVNNCLEDDYAVTTNVSFDQNDDKPWGNPLNSVSAEQVIRAIYSSEGPSVTVNYRVSPRMNFDLPLSSPAQSFYQSGESSLGNFAVERTEVDSTLIFRFSDTTGIISGNVQSGSESEGYNILDDLHFIVPSSTSDDISITVTFVSTAETITRVCLHHILNPSDSLCKSVPLETTTTKIPLLSPEEHHTVVPAEEFTTTYFDTTFGDEYNNIDEQNADDPNDSAKGKRFKWYIIVICLIVIGVVIGGLILFVKYRK